MQRWHYLLAVVLPPWVVVHYGNARDVAFNLILTAAFWVPGALHALYMVYARDLDQRNRRRPRLGQPNPFGA